jgi:hypothetical protein
VLPLRHPIWIGPHWEAYKSTAVQTFVGIPLLDKQAVAPEVRRKRVDLSRVVGISLLKV